jgi:hypothetical protein
MCGDPDRAPGEWHSEDYSEPFSFEPPASYPLCRPCHTRLHKRFNAEPGEWELFCLYLQAGGYGSEFVKLLTVAERRARSQRLASGSSVTLPEIRARAPGPYWWRSLTLAPESLEAPWARPRPLRPRPDAAAFARALEALAPSERQMSLLHAHAAAPRRTTNMRSLAASVIGSDNPTTANLLYGKLAHRLATELRWGPDRRPDGSEIWMSVVAEGWQPPRREYEWTMVAAMADALPLSCSS